MQRTKFTKKKKVYTLLYTNDPDQPIQYTWGELKALFIKWLDGKPINAIISRPTDLPRQFIYTSEGLNCKMDRELFTTKIKLKLRKTIKTYVNEKTSKKR